MTRILLALLALEFALPAHALQVVEGVEGRTHFVNVSSRDANRIAIEGGRILRLYGGEGQLAAQPDEHLGQVLLRPAGDDPVSLFVVSESGRTYTLVLRPQDIPAENIVIREARALPPARLEKADAFHRAIKGMLRALAGKDAESGLEVRKTWDEVRLWAGTRLVLTETHSGAALAGEKYRLFNLSGQPLRVAEPEFYKTGVLAVAVAAHEIPPGGSTEVYVVKQVR
jgi:conjugal transfer pilus assembly protein TraK